LSTRYYRDYDYDNSDGFMGQNLTPTDQNKLRELGGYLETIFGRSITLSPLPMMLSLPIIKPDWMSQEVYERWQPFRKDFLIIQDMLLRNLPDSAPKRFGEAVESRMAECFSQINESEEAILSKLSDMVSEYKHFTLKARYRDWLGYFQPCLMIAQYSMTDLIDCYIDAVFFNYKAFSDAILGIMKLFDSVVPFGFHADDPDKLIILVP